MSDRPDSIVITGCGWVTPFHAGPAHEVIAMGPGVAPPMNVPWWSIPRDQRTAFRDLPAECANDDMAFLPAAALRIARTDARFDTARRTPSPERVGLVLATALAGQAGMIDFADDVRAQSARFVSPLRFPQTVGNFVAGAIARGFELRGPNLTQAGGVAGGLDAIVEGAALLKSDQADLVFAGGFERFTQVLATGQARPGVLLSDGACLFAMERESDARRRGALVRAKFLSHSDDSTNTAFELTSCAGIRRPGAIWIEHWTGHCLGAHGAAALAAGIETASGFPVPYLSTRDPSILEYGPLRTAKNDALLTVVAGDENASTSARFIVPWDPRME